MPAKAKTEIAIPAAKSRPMPKFAPAPEWITELFSNLMRDYPQAERRKMFGYPSAFVNGNMACGVFADRMMVRLSEADQAKFLKLPKAKLFEAMPGHPMKNYVEIPREMIRTRVELKKWVKKGMAYTETMPPKVKKGK